MNPNPGVDGVSSPLMGAWAGNKKETGDLSTAVVSWLRCVRGAIVVPMRLRPIKKCVCGVPLSLPVQAQAWVQGPGIQMKMVEKPAIAAVAEAAG